MVGYKALLRMVTADDGVDEGDVIYLNEVAEKDIYGGLNALKQLKECRLNKETKGGLTIKTTEWPLSNNDGLEGQFPFDVVTQGELEYQGHAKSDLRAHITIPEDQIEKKKVENKGNAAKN